MFSNKDEIQEDNDPVHDSHLKFTFKNLLKNGRKNKQKDPNPDGAYLV